MTIVTTMDDRGRTLTLNGQDVRHLWADPFANLVIERLVGPHSDRWTKTGPYLGQPSIQERLHEILERQPTREECFHYADLQRGIEAMPTATEWWGYWDRLQGRA